MVFTRKSMASLLALSFLASPLAVISAWAGDTESGGGDSITLSHYAAQAALEAVKKENAAVDEQLAAVNRLTEESNRAAHGLGGTILLELGSLATTGISGGGAYRAMSQVLSLSFDRRKVIVNGVVFLASIVSDGVLGYKIYVKVEDVSDLLKNLSEAELKLTALKAQLKTDIDNLRNYLK